MTSINTINGDVRSKILLNVNVQDIFSLSKTSKYFNQCVKQLFVLSEVKNQFFWSNHKIYPVESFLELFHKKVLKPKEFIDCLRQMDRIRKVISEKDFCNFSSKSLMDKPTEKSYPILLYFPLTIVEYFKNENNKIFKSREASLATAIS